MLSVHPYAGALGAEIAGVDLSRDVDEKTFRNIVEALHEFEVVFLRGQDLTPEQHVAFSRRFGELGAPRAARHVPSRLPGIFVVSNVIENGKPIGSQDAGFFWHSDSATRRSRAAPRSSTRARCR
jgi:taurine dioxygenase